MSYSNLYLRKGKKTLYILGLVSCISFFVGMFVFVMQLAKENGWQKTEGIDRLYIVNRSPHGFEVIWSTKKPVKEEQWIEVGTGKERYFIRGNVESYSGIYRGVVSGLQANTPYYFRIRCASKTYILPSLLSEKIVTPKEIQQKPISPAYGKVILPSSKPYENGLLIYEIDGYYPLATFTKETGEWLLPLTGLIEKKSNAISSVSDSLPTTIQLFAYPRGNFRTIVGQTRPLRQVMVAGNSSLFVQTTKTGDASVLGATTQSSTVQKGSTSSISYPKENAIIPGRAPLIRGIAPVGSDITILIQGGAKQYSYRTKADEKGDWLVQYSLTLDSGKYTITATFDGKNGKSTIARRSFTIIKSGEQVLGVATGTPTLVPTIVPSLQPTVSPTTGVPTVAPTIAPTIIPSPTVILPTRFVPTVTPPVTGGGMSLYLFGALFCIVIGAGLVIAF